jgi:hypothetical protein
MSHIHTDADLDAGMTALVASDRGSWPCWPGRHAETAPPYLQDFGLCAIVRAAGFDHERCCNLGPARRGVRPFS